MPAVMILEVMAQATGILAMRSLGRLPTARTVYYFVGIDRSRFRQPVRPGDQLIVEVHQRRNSRGVIKAAANTAVATLGGPSDGEVYSVDINGQRVSVTYDSSVTDGSTATTNTELVDQLAQKINDLGIEGVTAENDGSDGLQLNNTNGFAEFGVDLLVDGAADATQFQFADDSLSDEDGQDFSADRTDIRLVGKSEKFEFLAGVNVEQGENTGRRGLHTLPVQVDIVYECFVRRLERLQHRHRQARVAAGCINRHVDVIA